jgi:hypothetical protein
LQLNAHPGEHTSNSKYPKKRREMAENSDLLRDEATISQNNLQSPRSTISSMDSDNASDLNSVFSVLSEMQNVLASK